MITKQVRPQRRLLGGESCGRKPHFPVEEPLTFAGTGRWFPWCLHYKSRELKWRYHIKDVDGTLMRGVLNDSNRTVDPKLVNRITFDFSPNRSALPWTGLGLDCSYASVNHRPNYMVCLI